TRGHRVVKNKAEAQRGKESKEVKSKAGRIENRRLKLGNDRKPARHVAVPKRQLVGSERLGDAELDRVEVSRQVAKEGELSGENNFVAKPEQHDQQHDERQPIFVLRGAPKFDGQIPAWHRQSETRSLKKRGQLCAPLFSVSMAFVDYGQGPPVMVPVVLLNVHTVVPQLAWVAVKRN